MGQYWKVFNLDKKEILHPHRFNDGLKFLEFVPGGNTMHVLGVLLAAPESMGQGGGDMRLTEWVGRWAGDRIVISGDYTDSGPFANLHRDEEYTEIYPVVNYNE